MSDTDVPSQAATDDALRRALSALRDLRTRLDQAERDTNEPIAVVGIGCRFPGGVETADEMFDLVVDGRDVVGPIPPDRWDPSHFDPDPSVPGKIYTDQGGFLSSPVDEYDPAFFGIAGPEAEFVDPQLRLLLEVSWEALEHGGLAADQLTGSRTGVFMGISTSDYGDVVLRSRPEGTVGPYDGNGSTFSMAAGRLSYFYGFRGPSLALDTACSSALVATALAVESLQRGNCDLALGGGVNLMLDPKTTQAMCAIQALSAKGRCSTFSAEADGYIRSEGCGVLVLKRLSDAEAAGDNIQAVIRSAVVNHDGRSSGLTVPSGQAQQEAIRDALDRAGLQPGDIDYVEAHGTGTPLGDPIEVRALHNVYSEGRDPDDPLLLGSVKANMGHAEAAAGAAGLIKAIMLVNRGELAPHLLHGERTPHIDWDAMPIELVEDRRPWPERERPRRAAVNAFGISGTNSHVIVEQPPPRTGAPASPSSGDAELARSAGPHLMTLSARNPETLQDLASRWADAVEAGTDSIADLTWTSQVARSRFASRLAVVSEDKAEMAAALRSFAATGEAAPIAVTGSAGEPAVGYLYTGQGAQSPGMGRALFEAEPVFRQALEECNELLRDELPVGLLDLLFGDAADERIHDTRYTQPALVSLEHALATQWAAWGVQPSAVAGHSIGEYAAAITAGVLDLGDGLRLAAARGRLMSDLPAGGAMVSVLAPEDDVRAVLGGRPRTGIAAVNGPRSIVVSGPGDEVTAVVTDLEAAGFTTRRLTVSHAFHSPLMDPMLDEFRRVAEQVTFSPPRLTFVSAVTGNAENERLTDPEYWVDHVRATVRFGHALQTIAAASSALLELGPRPVLSAMAGTVAPGVAATPSLHPDRDDPTQLRRAAAELWVSGIEPDWAAINGIPARTVDAPRYPFQRGRRWREALRRTGGGDRIHPLVHRRVRAPGLDDIVYESVLAGDDPAYLGDHRVLGTVVMPAAAYAEMALAAGRDAFGDGQLAVGDVTVREMLVLPDDADVLVATTIATAETGSIRFRVESREERGGEDLWRLHAEGEIRLTASTPPSPIDIEELRSGGQPYAGQRYEELADAGFDYGPMFRVVSDVVHGPGWSVARLSGESLPQSGGHICHPSLLDGCFQAIGEAVADDEVDTEDFVWVPARLGNINVFAPLTGSAWVVTRAEVIDDRVEAEIVVCDDDGSPLIRIDGYHSQRVPADAVWSQLSKATSGGAGIANAHLLHETLWTELGELSDSPAAPTGPWLVIGTSQAAAAIGTELAARGADVVTGPEQLDPELRLAGVVHVVDRRPGDAAAAAADVVDRFHRTVVSVLAGDDTAVGLDGPLWVVTAGAQPAADQIGPVDPAQSAIWGYTNALAAEMASVAVGALDVDADIELDPTMVVDELLAAGPEDRVAHRDGRRYGARLSQLPVREHHQLPEGPYELQLQERGTFGAIQIRTAERPEPAADEVVVAVRASGLNFRDVLNVLGMYPGAPGVPGNECAGTVVAVGSDVTDLAVGDEVVAMADGSFRRYAAVPQHLVFALPPEIDHVAAATLPITFLTAHLGFSRLAGLTAGQTVLVHSGAGGVGLAALQLARRAGATVIATAGSPAKRRYLRRLGAAHVFDSRSLDFKDDVLAVTGGRGVDVALNSLADEFIPATLDTVADGGVFLEIGKRGVWTDEQMAAARPDVAYHLYDLGEEIRRDPAPLGQAMRDILADIADGELEPLRRTTFPLDEVNAAFRYMANARHVGKVVVTQRPPAPTTGVHLITGGHGALGLRTAQELAERGASHIVLLSRSGPSPETTAKIDELRATGAEVVSKAGDAADRDSLSLVLADIRATVGPIIGLYHAAGVLADGIVGNLTPESFRTVFAPKVDGAWNLHTLTLADPIERFVLYSSVAAQLGSPGQSNYAAANAFLDGLAEHRRSLGLPAVSLAWGPWAEIGMAATSGGPRSGAAGAIAPDAGAAIITGSETLVPAHVGVIPINWRRFARLGAPGTDRPFLERVVTASADVGPVVDIRSQLDGLDPNEKLAVVREAVRSTVAEVLELPPASIDDHQTFPELGLDSLLGVELGNRLQRVLGHGSVAASAALEYPTVDALSSHLATDVLGLDGADVGGAARGVGAVVPVDRTGDIPVSGAQNRLLFIERFEPGLSIYNIFTAGRMTGPFDLDIAQSCFDTIIERHEALRTDFEAVDGRYYQRIRPPRPADFLVEDWTAGAESADLRLAEAMERAGEFARHPFDLADGLKLRTLVIRLATDDALVVSILHHTAGDGWSVARIIGEFLELYEARNEGRDHRLEEPSIHFADYSEWLRRRLESGELDAPIAYWRDQLSGELPVLSFPVDRARPPVRTYGAGNYPFEIPPELEAAARAWGAPSGATFFMTLLASYSATLARYTGQDDIVIGTATANRLRPEIEPLVGFVTNTLPLRVRMDLDADFATLVEQVRRVVLDGAANQEAPFDQVVADVRPPRDLSRPPILQTVFLMTDVGFPEADVAGLNATFVRVNNPTVDYEIGVDILDLEGRHQGVVRYNLDLFDEATAAQFVEHWLHLLSEAVSGASEPVGSLALTDGGVDLPEWSGTTVAHERTGRVHELFAEQAASTPDKVALVAGDERITYAELDRRANQLARHLMDKGVASGSVVGVAGDRSPEMVLSLLAVLKTGAAYVPLDPSYPPDRLRFMLEDTSAEVVIDCGATLASVLGDVDAVVIAPTDPSILATDGGPLPPSDGDLAYIIYTSGSTGRPKGVVLEHANVVNFLLAMIDEPGMTADDVVLAITSLSFDPSVLDLILPLVVGATAVLVPADVIVDGARLGALIDAAEPTLLQATPVSWNMLFDAGWTGRPGLRALCGGEAMSRDLADRLLDACDEVWNVFGPTETTVWSTIHRVEAGVEAIPIGRPIPNMVCDVVEPSGGLAPIGVPGELLIGGAGVSRGYHRRPELNAKAFIDDPRRPGQRIYRTGDLARWRRDGTLEFLGRIDHQVKVRGHRIELGEIEAGLRSAPSVREAVVVADGTGAAARLVGYLVPSDPSEPPPVADLRVHLQESVPDYMVPSVFVVMDEFPLTPSRKIDRKALPPADQGQLATSTDYVEPASATESVLAGILQDVLEVERAGAIDNFFELGGHSMQATTFLARVAAVFGHEVDLRDFFLEPSPRGVATALADLDGDAERVERIAEVEMTLAAMSDDEVDALLETPAESSSPEGP